MASYIRIESNNIKKVLQNTFNHCSGHVYPLITVDKHVCVLLGHNAKYNNVASFGGFSEQYEGSETKESLLDTILREYTEESLGCITDEETMKQKLFESSALITRESPKGHHYTAFSFIDGLNVDFVKANENFKHIRENSINDLTKGQLENDQLVCVPLENIKKSDTGEMANLTVNDIFGKDVSIRGINLPAYRWLLSSGFVS